VALPCECDICGAIFGKDWYMWWHYAVCVECKDVINEIHEDWDNNQKWDAFWVRYRMREH